MGYRSNIYCKVENSLVKEFDKLLKTNNMNDYFKLVEEQDSDTHKKYLGEDIKWYDSYPEVSAVSMFIDDNKDTCGMIAIGEDNATESWGSPWELSMCAYMNIDW